MTRRRGRAAGAVLFRPGRPDDAAAVARVMRAAVRGLPAGELTSRQRAAWSSLPALYHRWAMGPGGERYLVAERGGRVVGYAAYRSEAPAAGGAGAAGARRAAGREAELTAVFVLPAAGGAGIGTALVRAVERRVRRLGAEALSVLAAGPAIGFYAALGYSRGRDTFAPLPGGVRLPAAWMRRELEESLRGQSVPHHRGERAG